MISVVITSYNEVDILKKNINSILKSNFLDFTYEIIIVAPDSETESFYTLLSQENPKKNIIFVKDSARGKPNALLEGINQAKGDWILFTDGDVILAKDAIFELLSFLKKSIKSTENKNIGILTGRPFSLNNKKNLFGFWSHFLTDSAHLIRLKQNKNISASGYLYLVKNIEELKELPITLFSEDAYISKLFYKLNYSILYVSKAIVYVKYPTNFKDWILQKRRSTKGHLQLKNFFISSNYKTERSFLNEATFFVKNLLKYPKNIREYFYLALLIPARVYLWLLVHYDIRILKRSLTKPWKRIESTKNINSV